MTEPYRKKLIEVALPLQAINEASAREKSIRQGHPSTLHLWWARRPLATCRAVLFASIVDDPSSRPDLFATEEEQEAERQRLFRLIEELVKWENTNNECVLSAARAELKKSGDGDPPPVLDPFCGAGSIPLEAQRLGLEAHASDLNPVAVLITKALIELPSKFATLPPVNPDSRRRLDHSGTWQGANGLADDIRYYGIWLRERAFEAVGHLYPSATLPGGGEATVIAWLWARTVQCPNPACGVRMPLVRSFELSAKKGKEVHVQPVLEGSDVRFLVEQGKGRQEGTVGRRGAVCIGCGGPVQLDYVRVESRGGRMSQRLLALVVEGPRGRLYLSPDDTQERAADAADPPYVPGGEIADNPGHMNVYRYGLTTWGDIFTRRQLTALTAFSDGIHDARRRIISDGGTEAYGDAVATYLALAVDRLAMTGNTLVRWNSVGEKAQHAFGRQALPMVWDFAEPNFFASATGSAEAAIKLAADPIALLGGPPAEVKQLDATQTLSQTPKTFLICTDPPYYDNVPYADLSDLFYVWLRRSMASTYPDLFSTLLTPKTQELVASRYRFGGDRLTADRFFEEGLRRAFSLMKDAAHPDYPLIVFYAFKQAESENRAPSPTGWETMLAGLLSAGFAVTGTWPVRTEMRTRQVAMDANALASSIVLVCRPRAVDAPVTTRRDFVSVIRSELPRALVNLQHGNVAPVDLAQAAIGPGMAIFSAHSRVIEADGSEMNVRTALALINQAVEEILSEQEGDFDPDTRFAIAWFEQRGTAEGQFGEADVLARAKNVGVNGLVEAGILSSRSGRVRLLDRTELDASWDPAQDRRLTVWEVTQHLVKRLEDGGEKAAAELLQRVGGFGDTARELAYRLYTVCERKGWAQEALAYNALVVSWPEIARLVAEQATGSAQQTMGV